MPRRVGVLLAIAIASLMSSLAPTVALAQDATTAAAAFDQAMAEMKAGRFEAACPLFGESYRLDPRPGVLFTRAECEARWGKIATALTHYDDFLLVLARLPKDARSKHEERERVALSQKRALSSQVPKLTLVLPESAPKDTIVIKDGVELGRPLLGVALSVDPGEHVVTTSVPGGRTHEERITIERGASRRIMLTVPASVSSARPAKPIATPPANTARPAPADSDPSSTRRTLTYTALGIGVAGILVGGTAGVLALGKKKTVNQHCDGPACDEEGKGAADTGKTFALISTVGFGVGLAGTIAGVTLLATEPSPRSGAMLRIVGRF